MPIFDITFSTPLPSALMRFAHRLVRRDRDGTAGGEVLDRLHREVRVDRAGAVADEQRDVVHLADVTGLDDEPDLGAGLLADQVVVHGTR